MQLLLLLGGFVPLVLCDTIKINSPTRNQVINNSSFLIDYLIERNDNNNKLFLTNTTTELLDVRGNSLVSFGKNLTNSTMVRLDMRTFVQPNTVTNFTVKITAFGEYDVPVDGKQFGEFEVEVPLQLNLSNNSTNTTSTVSSRPNRTSTTSAPSSTGQATSTTVPTSTSTSAPSNSSGYSFKSTMLMSITSVFLLFLH